MDENSDLHVTKQSCMCEQCKQYRAYVKIYNLKKPASVMAICMRMSIYNLSYRALVAKGYLQHY